MGHVGPLGENFTFLSPLGLLEIQNFLSYLFILKLSYAKPFYSTLSYASITNIEEVMIDNYSMKQPDLYYFETIKMTSQA